MLNEFVKVNHFHELLIYLYNIIINTKQKNITIKEEI